MTKVGKWSFILTVFLICLVIGIGKTLWDWSHPGIGKVNYEFGWIGMGGEEATKFRVYYFLENTGGDINVTAFIEVRVDYYDWDTREKLLTEYLNQTKTVLEESTPKAFRAFSKILGLGLR